jgi:hypothetical protein
MYQSGPSIFLEAGRSTDPAETSMTAPTDQYAALRVVAEQLTALLGAHTPAVGLQEPAIRNLLDSLPADRDVSSDVNVARRRILNELNQKVQAPNPHRIGADLANIANALRSVDDTTGNLQQIVATATSLATAVAPYVAPLLLA